MRSKIPLKICWGVSKIKQYEKYLGLPSLVGKGKKASFNYIKERGELTKSKLVGGMGFKDLSLHNDALLAKQAWRLQHNKTFLFDKV